MARQSCWIFIGETGQSPELLSGIKFNYHDWETDVKVSVEKNGENFQLIIEAVKDDSGFVVAHIGVHRRND